MPEIFVDLRYQQRRLIIVRPGPHGLFVKTDGFLGLSACKRVARVEIVGLEKAGI